MKYLMIILVFSFSAHSQAQEVVEEKTLSQCENDLSKLSFTTRDPKKTKSLCKDYPQSVLNCATQLAMTKSLSYNFDSALADCNRKPTPGY